MRMDTQGALDLKGQNNKHLFWSFFLFQYVMMLASTFKAEEKVERLMSASWKYLECLYYSQIGTENKKMLIFLMFKFIEVRVYLPLN